MPEPLEEDDGDAQAPVAGTLEGEPRIKLIDVITKTELERTYWVRILDQEDDALRTKLGYVPMDKSFPGIAMRFFEYVAGARRRGDKRASRTGALALHDEWLKSITVGLPITVPATAGDVSGLVPPRADDVPFAQGPAGPPAQMEALLSYLVAQTVQQVAALSLPVPSQRLLTLPEVVEKMRLPKAWIRKHVPSITVKGARARLWRESDVDKFIASLPAHT